MWCVALCVPLCLCCQCLFGHDAVVMPRVCKHTSPQLQLQDFILSMFFLCSKHATLHLECCSSTPRLERCSGDLISLHTHASYLSQFHHRMNKLQTNRWKLRACCPAARADEHPPAKRPTDWVDWNVHTAVRTRQRTATPPTRTVSKGLFGRRSFSWAATVTRSTAAATVAIKREGTMVTAHESGVEGMGDQWGLR